MNLKFKSIFPSQDGLKILTEACEVISETITKAGGSFKIQTAPKVVTATDEADLAKQLERAEMENAEVLLIDM